MQRYLWITITTALVAVCRGAIEGTEPSSKLTSNVAEQGTKDLETSASDRTFLIGRDYGYGSGSYGSTGYGNGYGTYPSTGGSSIYTPTATSYYNRGNTANSVYRGYQPTTGYGGVLGGGNTGWGYYGNGGYGYGGLGGGTLGYSYGGYDDPYAGYGGRGYNRWNGLDGYGGYAGTSYGNVAGVGYGNYGSSGYGASSYPYGYRGNSYGSYSGSLGYPSGYRGYS